MVRITIIITWVVALLLCQNAMAQETDKEKAISILKEQIDKIKANERDALKEEVEAINERLDRGEINFEEAKKLKKEAAEKRALNIENRVAIIENKIALVQRNEGEINLDDYIKEEVTSLEIGWGHDGLFGFKINEGSRKRRIKYDRRTTSDLVVAIGFNNALIDGQGLDDSPYNFGGSRFFELGWAWKTRVFKNSNWLRIKYGFSFQWNGLKPKDNQYFVEQGDQTVLETFPFELKKSKFRMDNLVIPVHFEFGPSKKRESEKYIRYSTRRQFKMGLGGYAGFNIGTRQKLKYRADGERVKDKFKRDYNTSDLVYGLSGYVAFGSVGIYAKYDLSPIFKDAVVEQNNISLGVRFDMD